MPPRRSSDAQRFHRIAVHRFEDAEILLANDRTTGAAYLGGYSIECGFKALLLARTPVANHPSLTRFFSGRLGHDLEELKRALRARGVVLPDQVNRWFVLVRTWSTDIRYTTGVKKAREVKAFLDAAFGILEWVGGQL